MLLRCAIVENVDAEAQKLAQALQAAAAGLCQVRAKQFSGGALLEGAALADCDAVFLDIGMPGTDGIETARRLWELSPQMPLVFVAASGDYVWQALSTHPFAYLLKPYDIATLTRLLADLLRTVRHAEREIEVRFDRKKLHVPLDAIHCITAQNHAVSVVTDQGEYRAASNFSQLKEELHSEPRFLACNRGVLVNMDKIRCFGDETIEMRCGKIFPVRQRDKKRLFAAFTQYRLRRTQEKN